MSDYSVRYNPTQYLVKNVAVNAPIKFEKRTYTKCPHRQQILAESKMIAGYHLLIKGLSVQCTLNPYRIKERFLFN